MSTIVPEVTWLISPSAYDSDADDEDEEEEWITDEEDVNRYYAPYLMPMPATPDIRGPARPSVIPPGSGSDSDSDDEGPPPLIPENEMVIIPPIGEDRMIEIEIISPSPSQDDEASDSDDDLPPLVGEDRRIVPQRSSSQPRDTSEPEPRGFSIINELMSVIGGFPAFSSGGGGSNFYQAR